MSVDDICAQAFEKEWRMVWSRAFIRTWLLTPEMQFPHSLELMAIQANRWILRSTDYRQAFPVVSAEDIKEAGMQVLGELQ